VSRDAKGLIAAIVALIVVVALFCGIWAWMDDRCRRKGGHLVGVYKGSICVSADGRVIE